MYLRHLFVPAEERASQPVHPSFAHLLGRRQPRLPSPARLGKRPSSIAPNSGLKAWVSTSKGDAAHVCHIQKGHPAHLSLRIPGGPVPAAGLMDAFFAIRSDSHSGTETAAQAGGL